MVGKGRPIFPGDDSRRSHSTCVCFDEKKKNTVNDSRTPLIVNGRSNKAVGIRDGLPAIAQLQRAGISSLSVGLSRH